MAIFELGSGVPEVGRYIAGYVTFSRESTGSKIHYRIDRTWASHDLPDSESLVFDDGLIMGLESEWKSELVWAPEVCVDLFIGKWFD